MNKPGNIAQLIATSRALVAPRKGILAADESFGSIEKRFKSIGVKSTEKTRRQYREMLFTTSHIEEYISGVILFDETIRQKTNKGVTFPKYLKDRGIIPGIKVDTGAYPLAFSPGEKVTEGLDGLRGRLQEYYKLGARFTKWRAVINISVKNSLPTDYCISVNAHALARYAALCQEEGMVPIIEPEIVMNSCEATHDIIDCEEATTKTLQAVFEEMTNQGVMLSGTLMKVNMVLPGTKGQPATIEDIVKTSLKTYYRTVPAAVPGIVFLSGGMKDTNATLYLNEMVKAGPHPWELSFSYGRALQAVVLKAWDGKMSNVEIAHTAFYKRCRLNSLARAGEYAPDMEKS